jgi:hypothetical protein
MKHSTTFFTLLAAVLYFGVIPASAQHGRGFGGGTGKGSGMPSSRGGEVRGHSERETGPLGRESSKGDTVKGTTSATGNKTAGELLTQNTKLSSKLQGLLPAGTNLQDAASGFDHLGQFVSAVHVSHNLDIPFDQLKSKLVGPSAVSLGEAIHQLRPEANAKQEATKANKQALEDMKKSTASNKPAAAAAGSGK